MERDRMRVGDGDREAAAQRLKGALDEGRLDIGEYDERMQRAYAAKTFADLDGLTADLPGAIPAQQAQLAHPAAHEGPTPGQAVGEVQKPGGPPWIAGYAGVVVVCVIIWAVSCLATGDWIYPWPLWMLIPLVFGIIGRMASRRDR